MMNDLINRAVNEIKHDHSPVVIVVLDPRYDQSYNTPYNRIEHSARIHQTREWTARGVT